MHSIAQGSTATPNPSDRHSDTEAFEGLVASLNLTFEEWDTTKLSEHLRDKFFALYIESHGRKVIVVPAGQDPAHRLAAVRSLLSHLEVTA